MKTVMQKIYESYILSWFYHQLKALYGFLTGTTELYRICDAVVQELELKQVVIPSGLSAGDCSLQECRKLTLDPQVLYRMGILIIILL
jgi:hypothetical protein